MRSIWVASVLSALATLGTAGPGHAQSIEDALVSAYLSNPELTAQRAALRATDELVPQALGGWRPTVTVQSTAAYADIDSSSGSGDILSTSNVLALDQNIYRGGETSANLRRAERLVRAERARLAAVEQSVLLDAVEAYTALLADFAVRELAIQNENRLRRQLQATRDRFEVGEVTRTDVAQSEASLSGSLADRVRAEGAIRASQAVYVSVINQEPVSLQVPPPLADLPASETEAQQLAEAVNPNIAVAQYNLAAAREEVNLAYSAIYPKLSLRGELGYTDEPSLGVDWQRDATIAANLVVPLYQGGAEYARIRETKEIVRQRREDLEATYRSVRQEVTSARQALATARSTIEAFREQVRAAEVALEGSRQEALVGQRTTLDVLDQENDLFSAEVDLVSAQRDEIVASYRLKAAIGALTVRDLDLDVEAYDSELHYDKVRNRWFGDGQSLDAMIYGIPSDDPQQTMDSGDRQCVFCPD